MPSAAIVDWLQRARSWYVGRLARPGPLLRIGAWSLVFLYFIGGWIDTWHPSPKGHYAHLLQGDSAITVALGRTDPAGFVRDVPPKRPDEFRIAWISGSSVHALGNDDYDQSDDHLLPEPVCEGLDVGHGRQATVLVYYLDAARLYDTHQCLLDAVTRDPDAIVLALNPVWVFCDKDISFWSNLYAPTAANVARAGQGLGIYLALTSPASVADGLLRPLLPGLDHRYPGLRKQARYTLGSLGLKSYGQRHGGRPVLSSPLRTWFSAEVAGVTPATPVTWQAAVLDHYVQPDRATLNHAILDAMFTTLARADVPALVYTPPLRPSFARSSYGRECVARVNVALARLTERHAAPHVRFWVCPANHEVPDADFVDLLHLRQGAALVARLRGELEALLLPRLAGKGYHP